MMTHKHAADTELPEPSTSHDATEVRFSIRAMLIVTAGIGNVALRVSTEDREAVQALLSEKVQKVPTAGG